MATAFYYEDKNTMQYQWQVQAFALSPHLLPPLILCQQEDDQTTWNTIGFM